MLRNICQFYVCRNIRNPIKSQATFDSHSPKEGIILEHAIFRPTVLGLGRTAWHQLEIN